MNPDPLPASDAVKAPSRGGGRDRWVICALLFFATSINYIGRQVFGILAPEMKKLFGWSDANYTDIMFWFEVAYAIGLLTVRRMLDWIGVRVGFALAMIFWSGARLRGLRRAGGVCHDRADARARAATHPCEALMR